MPELPEVETMRRGVQPVVGGQVVEIEFPRLRCKPISLRPGRAALRKRLIGRRIESIERAGKRLVFHFDADLLLVVEPRMTGLVLLADPPDPDHLRIVWHLRDAAAPTLAFWDRRGLGTLRLLDQHAYRQLLGPDRLGPDALEVTAGTLRERWQASRRAIKVAMLDQRDVAGIGNLYAAEILFEATIDPRRPCHQLADDEWERLAAAIPRVLQEAIRYEGSTLADGTYRNALNRAGGYQNHRRVYARSGELCRRCGRATIVRIVQAQRATFFCPGCQT